MLNNRWVWVGLLVALAASVFTHASVFDKDSMPTYGNTNIHVATSRDFVQSGNYPVIDYSYGGGIPNLYVPLYRVSASEIVWLTGWNFDFASRMLVMLIALLTPLGLFLLAREWFGPATGVFAALIASLPAELLIYTFRPLPQALGLGLLCFAVYSIAASRPKLAALFAFLIGWVHQEAAIFLSVSTFALAGVYALQNLLMFFGAARSPNRSSGRSRRWTRLSDWREWLSTLTQNRAFVAAFGAWFVVSAAYLAWHFSMVGDLNFTKLAQFQNHEGNPLSWENAVKLSSWPFLILSSAGALLVLAWLAVQRALPKRFTKSQSVVLQSPRATLNTSLVLAWALVGVLFVFNRVFNALFHTNAFGVFEDRFLVYLQLPMVLLAALAVTLLSNALYAFIIFAFSKARLLSD